VTRQLTVTSRADLRQCSGVNTHFCFNPSVYSVGKNPNAAMVNNIINLGVGYIRERWFPTNAAQQAAFKTLTAAGVRLYLFVGDMTYAPADVAADMAALAASPFVGSVEAVCGPNEPNAHGGTVWPGKVTNIQKAIYQAVYGAKNGPDLKWGSDLAVVGPVLKHNVDDIDGDYQALAAAGIQRWCSIGDFHFYPGSAGPIGNAAEAVRAGQAYGALPLYQSETGWTGADTDPGTAGRFSVEAYLRNYLTGIVGTLIYELADESQYVPGREGLFGLVTPTLPKTGYTMTQSLLTTPDGGEDFPGSLGTLSGVESDAQIIVTSEGGGNWTVYLMKQQQGKVTLILPSSYTCDIGIFSQGNGGNNRYTINFDNTMMVAHVSPSVQLSQGGRENGGPSRT
jgi:hypothetical protein